MQEKIRYRLVYNYSGKLNSDGRSPVACEARQGSSKAYFSSNILIYPHQWRKGTIVNHDNAEKLTVYLHRWMHSIEEVELDMLLNGCTMTLAQLKSAVRSGTKASATLSEFVRAVIDPSTRSRQTKSAYHTLANEAEKYDKGITIGAITHDWIEGLKKAPIAGSLTVNLLGKSPAFVFLKTAAKVVL